MSKILGFLIFVAVGCTFTEKEKKASPHKAISAAIIKDSVVFIVDDSSSFPAINGFAISLYYHDSLGYGHPFGISPHGATLFLTHPTFFLQADEKQTPFLIYPEEKIYVRYTKNGNLKMYRKEDQKRSAELSFFQDLIKETGNLSFAFKIMPHLTGKSTKDSIFIAEKQIDSLLKDRMSLLGKKQDELSKEFIAVAANAIRSAAMHDSLVLYWNNRLLLGNKELQEKIGEKSNSINSFEFLPFIFNTKLSNSYTVSLLTGNPYYSLNDSVDIVKAYSIIKANLIGARKDFLLTRLVLDAYNRAMPISQLIQENYYSECLNEEYKALIKRRLTATDYVAESKNSGNSLRTSDGKKIADLQQILEQYKDLLVVIDFWASWCVPCRAEMPFAKNLKEKYKDKPVAFLYISIDDNTGNWLKAAEQEKLNTEDSYLFLNSEDAPFVKKYGLHSIPRYMLLGKNGKILLSDAPRPSDPELEKQIDRFLKTM